MSIFFFFNDPATTEIYPLSLHDALPICRPRQGVQRRRGQGDARPTESVVPEGPAAGAVHQVPQDRKSTRLNSSHSQISYAVFCLKKKKKHDSDLYEPVLH